MNFRTVSNLLFAAIISLFVLSFAATGSLRFADGGAPVPPYPPQLIADGGAPVPPYPPQLIADGGAPVPPYPPQLIADGGAPVPPYPPHFEARISL